MLAAITAHYLELSAAVDTMPPVVDFAHMAGKYLVDTVNATATCGNTLEDGGTPTRAAAAEGIASCDAFLFAISVLDPLSDPAGAPQDEPDWVTSVKASVRATRATFETLAAAALE